MFTPGKWEVFLGEEYSTIESDHQTICTNVSSGDDYLIAAAPDMYEALEAINKYLETGYPQNMRLKEIAVVLLDKALAKAEGK